MLAVGHMRQHTRSNPQAGARATGTTVEAALVWHTAHHGPPCNGRTSYWRLLRKWNISVFSTLPPSTDLMRCMPSSRLQYP